MSWSKKNLWNIGVAGGEMLFLLMCLTLIPPSVASAHEKISGAATPGTVTVQAKPTEDATVAALNKEKLAQEVQQLKSQNEPDFFGWLQVNATLLSTLLVVGGGLIAWGRWLADRRSEREKRVEERFQAAVTWLGDEKDGAKIGAAILLRTFLHAGYKQFYLQIFDLAVAHLRLPQTPRLPEEDSDALHASSLQTAPTPPLPLTPLRQALIVVFKEAIPLVRSQTQRSSQFLDATGIQLDNASLRRADLDQVWMPKASLRKADLVGATLNEAILSDATLSRAMLYKATLNGAHLHNADLSHADLSYAKLNEAKLNGAHLDQAILIQTNLCGANLSRTNIEQALFLQDTDLRGVTGLDAKQKAACKKKGAQVDEDSTTSTSQSTIGSPPAALSNDVQTSSTPPAQKSTPSPDPDGSNTASSQQEPES